MPIYHYVGINYQGKKVKADFSCQDPIELKDELRKQNIILRSYTQAQEKRRSDFLAVSSGSSPLNSSLSAGSSRLCSRPAPP
jgi:type II secretory pathway component PulF